MIKVSVIVPMHNIENYIKDCAESLLIQTLPDVELIFVDDHSTDRTVDILSTLIEQSANAYCVENVKKGAAEARNTGLELATGKYISFVDGDDIVKPEFLERLYRVCEKDGLDMACGSYEAVYPDGTHQPRKRKAKFLDFRGTGAELLKVMIIEQDYIPMIWPNLYQRDFLLANQLRLLDTVHEDEDFIPRVLLAASSVKLVNYFDYLYRRQREQSIITTRDASSVASLEEILRNFVTDYEIIDETKQTSLAYVILRILDHYVYYSRISQQIDRKLIKKALFCLRQSSILSAYQMRKYRLILMSSKLYYLLQNLRGIDKSDFL